ncbi:hypothetical protein [Streptomyces lincolnensis]|uniref:hypothetical protein n=1 Tax=Streptomyces lincolnensis TaxID=1915 RepID=UPI001352089D|nr:hypothetical protein [Streptomyces lincolnensis]QMV04298.1 hypothetical protein GJU35_00355 [Streptomyces lincolnensis]QMV12025.1 hypothetical protein GJU35_44565 [Streptomyces lincolnensis]
MDSRAPMCDFCGRPGAVVYYAVTEYRVVTPSTDWYSSDRLTPPAATADRQGC